jgi:phosphatidylserine/phosphatidylglycerophosphate/cardiolipin synthase-like enzyme
VREQTRKNGITVNAVAGTRVVFLGLDLIASHHEGCLGFAVQRHDPAKDETVWLRGKKTFPETNPGVGPRGTVSTYDHPIQGFWWADYEVAPERTYTYTIVPRYGKPTALTRGRSASVTVTTEAEHGKHSVFFNRGAIASQEYARDFGEVPAKLTGETQQSAYIYLSHGLFEALKAFIARATGPEWSLRGAMYEFHWRPVLDALGAARKRKAKVSIVYDANGQLKNSTKAIDDAGIGGFCTPRPSSKIMHNKFLVLSHNDTPVAVWTGSTNVSENGIFGHLNVGHAVEDPEIAAAYLTYWKQLKGDPPLEEQRAWIDAHDPIPAPEVAWTAPLTTVFSPHSDLAVLKRYRDIAKSASQALCMTFAFGMHDLFKDVYRLDDRVLRMALMEDYGAASNQKKQEQIIKSTIQPRSNVVVSIGGSIPTNGFDAWVKESTGITNNVQWVHTKFMVVDPLSTTPTVITGSANFSVDSTRTNDENMLVIRDDLRVADIYFTEYMRLFAHYGFREAVAIAVARNENWHPGSLKTDWRDWLPPYVKAGDDRDTRRRYFSTGKTT